MTMWLRVENVDTAVIRAKEDELRWLSRYLSIEDASAAYRGGGTIELLTPASTFPTGLLDFVLEEAAKAGFQVQLMDTRVQPVQYDKTADLNWLRDYQDEAVEWALALPRGIFHHPTGAGKTEIIAAISRMYYCPWLITVNKKDLLYQTAERIERRVGEAPGIVGDGKFDVRRVTVGMYQTLHSDLLGPRKFPWDSIQGWMGDECFPAGTIVGSQTIERVQVGDLVPAYDVPTQSYVTRRVTAVFNRVPASLVRVRLRDSTTFVCTPSHPVRVDSGWCRAGALTRSDSVLRLEYAQTVSMCSLQSPHLHCYGTQGVHRVLPRVSVGSPQGACDDVHSLLPGMWRASCVLWQEGSGEVQKREALLFGQVPTSSVLPHDVKDWACHGYRQLCDAFSAHEGQQPNAFCRSPRTAENRASCAWLEALCAWGQRVSTACTTSNTRCRSGVGDGSSCEDQRVSRGTNLLQGGYCKRSVACSYRGGWAEPLTTLPQAAGQSQGHVFSLVGVDRVEVLERGSDGTFGGMCPDGAVYNLEVEDTHTYIANGVVVHNCHNVAAGTYLRVSSNLINAYWRFGFSGTPLSRSDRKSLLVVAATGKVIHRIRHETLVEAGVLAKPTIRMVPIVHTASILLADWNTAYTHLVVRSAARNEALCTLARNAEKPCLLFVKEIEHGHILQRMLQKQGVAVEFVWGEKVTPQRTASIRRLVHGDIDVLIANVIFQEGVDIPELMSVVIGSGGKSPIMCLQDVGRGMRRRNKAGEEVKSEFFVYDIQDKSCGCGTFRDGRWQYEHLSCKWLEQHARLRRRAYISEGYTVVLA